jgi:hypothetical protein
MPFLTFDLISKRSYRTHLHRAAGYATATFGITQLVGSTWNQRRTLRAGPQTGQRIVVSVEGLVRERTSKNPNRPTGDIEIEVKSAQGAQPRQNPALHHRRRHRRRRRPAHEVPLPRPSPQPVQRNIIFRSRLGPRNPQVPRRGRASPKSKRPSSSRARRKAPAILWCPAA